VLIIFIFLLLLTSPFSAAQTNHLAAFSEPAKLWGNGIERVIEEAFRQCIRTKIIDGKVMNLRIPFAMNSERDFMVTAKMNFVGDGKGNPELLWPVIEEVLESEDFERYVKALSSGREKVVVFDMIERSWSLQTDMFIITRIKAGSFIGLPHRPYVLTSGKGVTENDVYNYIYCIGYAGVDCSGFVWYILSYIAKYGGLDLGRALSSALGVPPGANPSHYVGTAFFNSRSSHILPVIDEIRNLRPADIMLFRDIDGTVIHSAIIQSIDFNRGVIRYLQCNNVAVAEERGVHDSFIYFDPANPSVSLKDPSLHWTKKRFPTFAGEDFTFADDGERYRHRVNGGGRVVRLRALVPVIERINRN